MTIGIYQINIGNYVYFGSSKNVENRLKDHEKHLKLGKHGNKKMQDVYNKHQSFDAYCVCETELNNRFIVEQDYINTHYGLKECLNINSRASGGNGMPIGRNTWSKGKKVHSEEHKLKVAESNKLKPRTLGKTWKQQIIECPHCAKTGGASTMKRYHFNNCKEKK